MSSPKKSSGAQMTQVGVRHIRVEGYTSVAGMYLGGWNQLAEKIQTIIHNCLRCGKIDFYEFAG